MILSKGKRNHTLMKNIDYLDSCIIEIGSSVWERITQVSHESMLNMIKDDDNKIGKPTFVAHSYDKHKIMVYPRPDKNYKIKVRGCITIEQ